MCSRPTLLNLVMELVDISCHGKQCTFCQYLTHMKCLENVGMLRTKLVMEGVWRKPDVFNVEEFDPAPYMEALNEYGLPWVVEKNSVSVK